jgi:hypothetical protein
MRLICAGVNIGNICSTRELVRGSPLELLLIDVLSSVVAPQKLFFDKVSWKAPGMSQDLFKIFEKYRLEERAMLCLWVNGQLNTAIPEPSRILELQDRLKEWLQEL